LATMLAFSGATPLPTRTAVTNDLASSPLTYSLVSIEDSAMFGMGGRDCQGGGEAIEASGNACVVSYTLLRSNK
jgi:hypothetical protein